MGGVYLAQVVAALHPAAGVVLAHDTAYAGPQPVVAVDQRRVGATHHRALVDAHDTAQIAGEAIGIGIDIDRAALDVHILHHAAGTHLAEEAGSAAGVAVGDVDIQFGEGMALAVEGAQEGVGGGADGHPCHLPKVEVGRQRDGGALVGVVAGVDRCGYGLQLGDGAHRKISCLDCPKGSQGK